MLTKSLVWRCSRCRYRQQFSQHGPRAWLLRYKYCIVDLAAHLDVPNFLTDVEVISSNSSVAILFLSQCHMPIRTLHFCPPESEAEVEALVADDSPMTKKSLLSMEIASERHLYSNRSLTTPTFSTKQHTVR